MRIALTQEERECLQKSGGKTVRLHFHDGEITLAEILWLDNEYDDVIFNFLSTNRPEKYEKHRGAAFAADLKDIERLEFDVKEES